MGTVWSWKAERWERETGREMDGRNINAEAHMHLQLLLSIPLCLLSIFDHCASLCISCLCSLLVFLFSDLLTSSGHRTSNNAWPPPSLPPLQAGICVCVCVSQLPETVTQPLIKPIRTDTSPPPRGTVEGERGFLLVATGVAVNRQDRCVFLKRRHKTQTGPEVEERWNIFFFFYKKKCHLILVWWITLNLSCNY